MKTSQMIQSKYLKKDDFPQPEVLTIKDCTLEEVGKGDTRWVLWFKEKAKGVVLNVTKIKQLETAYGDDSDNWNGKKVKLSDFKLLYPTDWNDYAAQHATFLKEWNGLLGL